MMTGMVLRHVSSPRATPPSAGVAALTQPAPAAPVPGSSRKRCSPVLAANLPRSACHSAHAAFSQVPEAGLEDGQKLGRWSPDQRVLATAV